MTRDEFWSFIDRAGGDEAVLEQALRTLDPVAIESFQMHFDELHALAYCWGLWGAAYVMEGGCSDDGFTDFRYGLIALGRRRFEEALHDPDSLCGTEATISNEAFGYAALGAYESVTGRKLVACASPPPADPAGEEWDFDDEVEVRRRLPRLAEKFMG